MAHINTKEEQVRYSRDELGRKKNTLYTFRKDGFIYWGVSRCKTELDRFNKEMGITISKGRALKAIELDKNGIADDWQFQYMLENESGMRPTYGRTKIENVKALVDWFKNL